MADVDPPHRIAPTADQDKESPRAPVEDTEAEPEKSRKMADKKDDDKPGEKPPDQHDTITKEGPSEAGGAESNKKDDGISGEKQTPSDQHGNIAKECPSGAGGDDPKKVDGGQLGENDTSLSATIPAGSPTATATDKIDQCSKLLALKSPSAEAWGKILRSLSLALDKDHRIKVDINEEILADCLLTVVQNRAPDDDKDTGQSKAGGAEPDKNKDKVDQCSKLLAQMTQRTEEWAKTLRFLSSAPDEDRRTKVDKETRANVGVVDGKNNKSDSEENTGLQDRGQVSLTQQTGSNKSTGTSFPGIRTKNTEGDSEELEGDHAAAGTTSSTCIPQQQENIPGPSGNLDSVKEKSINNSEQGIIMGSRCMKCIKTSCVIFNKCALPFAFVALVLALCVANLKVERFATHLDDFFEWNPESADEWEKLNRRSIHILVTGKTGTGKSALINGLLGRNVTREGDTLDPQTSQVEQFKQMVHGISLSVFDSPGLQDGTTREEEYLRDMEQKCATVDLVLYAIKMTDQRVHALDTNAMKKITNAFGHRFWEKAVFVMTFANEVRSPVYPDDEIENEKYFEKRLQDWRDKLPELIERRSGIPATIGRQVPIVPAGYYKTRDLPGQKYWFSLFWKAALNRLMESNAEGAGYMLQFSKDRFKKVDNTTDQDFEKPIHEQPILSNID